MSAATLAIPPTHEITRKDLKTTQTGRKYSDEAAVKIVVTDFDTCNNFIQQQQWAARWTDADTLVQSPQSLSPWGQGIGTRASVPNFLLSNSLDVVCPKIVGAITYENPPFLLRPRPGVSAETIRAKTAVASYQMDDMNFVEFVDEAIYDDALLGTVIAKWGWIEEERTEREFTRKAQPQVLTSPVGYRTVIHTEDSDAIEFEYVTQTVRRPYIEKKMLGRVMGDPACKTCNIQKAKWVTEASYVDWDDLERLRQLEDYDIPSKEVLMDWFFDDKKTARGDNAIIALPEGMRSYLLHASPQNYPTSADPLAASLLMVERQDEHSIMCVLWHGADCILIRNSENPFARISKMAGGTGHTYLSSVWRRLTDSQYGQGLGQIIGTRQMVAQGTENLALEVAAYPLHPTFTRVMGWNTPTQQISLGTGDVLAVEGDDVRKGIGLLEMPKVPPEVWQILQYNKSESLEGAGTDQQYGMGSSSAGIQTSGTRSGTGAALKGKAVAGRLDGPTERFINQIFTPFMFIMDQLNNQLLPTSDIRKILADEDPTLPFDHIAYRNAKMKFEVLAGSHLGPKAEMTQFLAVIEQIAINPALLEAAAQADMKFNFTEWFKSFADLSGFKFSQQFFVEMTAQEKQRRDQNSKTALLQAQNQANLQKQSAAAQQKNEQIFNQGLARAGEKVTVLQAEHALQLGQEVPGTDTVG